MPNETPKLDKIASFDQNGIIIYQKDIIEALLEIRSLLKVARIGATNVPREGT